MSTNQPIAAAAELESAIQSIEQALEMAEPTQYDVAILDEIMQSLRIIHDRWLSARKNLTPPRSVE